MSLFKRVAIIGTGLIGGSMALALKKKGLCQEVVGVSRKQSSLRLAKATGAIDRGSSDINIIRDADLVVMATPVETIISLAPAVCQIIKPSCIVTDVGSTKKKIVSRLEKIFPFYVGSHPLAGSERRGISSARPDLFKDSFCILTPTKKTNKGALRKVRCLWEKLGVSLCYLSPDEHDRIFSFVSHLPHLAAFSLMKAIPGRYLKFAAAGLKNTTRIAGSDSEIWSSIFLSNQKHLLRAIGLLQKELSQIKNSIRDNDEKRLIKILKVAKAKRDSL